MGTFSSLTHLDFVPAKRGETPAISKSRAIGRSKTQFEPLLMKFSTLSWWELKALVRLFFKPCFDNGTHTYAFERKGIVALEIKPSW